MDLKREQHYFDFVSRMYLIEVLSRNPQALIRMIILPLMYWINCIKDTYRIIDHSI